MHMICISIAGLLLAGCGEKKNAKEYVQQAAEKYTSDMAKDIERIKYEFKNLKRTYEQADFAGLKEVCVGLDQRYDQRILSWYADILLIEHTQGTGAAREAIARLKGKEQLSRKEVRALDDIEGYFKDKGNRTTIGLLLSVYAVYLEGQYGHGAGAPLGALLEITGQEAQLGAATNRSQPMRAETNSSSTAGGARP